MPRLTQADRETIDDLGHDLWNFVFQNLESELVSPEESGRVAAATQRAFEKSLTKLWEVDL